MAKIQNKLISKQCIKNHTIAAVDNRRIDVLYNNISNYINIARNNVVQTINTEQVKAYWFIGRDIVEEEQTGKERAQYGVFLLKEISTRLTKDFGKGFSVDTLERARKFYLTYSNVITSKSAALRRKLPKLSEKLGWTHYRALIHEPRPEVRSFYQLEAEKNCWSARELDRQMASLLFERLARSRDKRGLMKLACKGQEIIKPEDTIKEPVVLEFLNIPESHKLVESRLEEALISNMQNFLLEMGHGVRHEAVSKSCFRESREPSMLLDESRGMNKELSRQCNEMLISIGKKSQDIFPSGNHNRVSC